MNSERRTLFHVSPDEFTVGADLHKFPAPRYFGREPNYRAVEDRMEELRPIARLSRQTSHFAFESMAFCQRYWEARTRLQGSSNSPRYYKVEMEAEASAPMLLVDHAIRLYRRGLSIDPVIDEYWSPTRDWLFHEYLGRHMKVLAEEQQDAVADDTLALHYAMEDQKLARRIWPFPQP